MKPLYWKFLLIFGTIIVGASLLVPKALRKNEQDAENQVTQTRILMPTGYMASDYTKIDTHAISTPAKKKYSVARYIPDIEYEAVNSAKTGRITLHVQGLALGISVGTLPTKLRVVKQWIMLLPKTAQV